MLVLPLVLLGACLLRLTSGAATFRIPECALAASCPAGFTCTSGYCVSADATNALTVDLQLTPGTDTGYLRPAQFAAKDLSTLATASVGDFALPPSADLSGKIIVSPDASTSPSTIEIVAERPGAIAGTSVRFSTFAQKTLAGDWTYALAVLPGTYAVTLTPKDSTLPPLTIQDASVQASGTRDFSLGDPASLIEVKGRVVQVGSEVATVGGLTVQLVDKAAQICSTTATTAADGTFTVWVAPGATEASLQVRSTEASGLFPAVDVDAGAVTPGFAAGDVSLGDLSGGLVTTTFRVLASDGGAVAKARVRSVGTVGAGTVTATGTTGATGEWGIALYAGAYVVEVAPPAGAGSASTRSAVTIGALASRVDLTLPDKVPISVSVTSNDGVPVSAASVLLRRVAELDASAAPWVIDEIAATTDSNGGAAVMVDPGRYDVVATPVPSARLPSATIQGAALSAGTALAVTLPRGLTVLGRVLGRSGDPVADVLVEFFATTPGATKTPPVIGSSVSASDGTFAVTLPNP
jgi:hypothetical protein